MSDLGKLVAAPRPDVLPGITLPRARLSDFAMVEEEIERRHLAKAGSAAVGLPESIAKKIIDAATDDMALGRFRYGRGAFDSQVLSSTFLPFLLYVLLRHSDDKATIDKAEGLITDENRDHVHREVLLQFRYSVGKQEAKPGNGQAVTTESTGSPSSPPLDNAA